MDKTPRYFCSYWSVLQCLLLSYTFRSNELLYPIPTLQGVKKVLQTGFYSNCNTYLLYRLRHKGLPVWTSRSEIRFELLAAQHKLGYNQCYGICVCLFDISIRVMRTYTDTAVVWMLLVFRGFECLNPKAKEKLAFSLSFHMIDNLS